MIFSGDLSHVPLVDIFHLLYNTKKSGVLSVKLDESENRIVFASGYIVSANYLNGKVRIGSVLVKMGFITGQDLEEGLELQEKAGTDRQPLITTLVEMEKVKNEDALLGLKKLVEMTVVEILGWSRGTFSLDPESMYITDQSMFSPEKLEHEMYLDTQMVLTDSLHLHGKKQHDGGIGETAGRAAAAEETGSRREGIELTPDDLDLIDIVSQEATAPPTAPIKALDPVEVHRQKIKKEMEYFPADKQEELVSFLAESTAGPERSRAVRDEIPSGMVLFSRDELLIHSIATVTRQNGVQVFSTGDEDDLDPIFAMYLRKRITPLLVFDGPGIFASGLSANQLASLRQRERDRHPNIATVQLVSSLKYNSILQSFDDGIRAVLPRPSWEAQGKTYVQDVISFLRTFRSHTKSLFLERGENASVRLREAVEDLRDMREAREISLVLLEYVSGFFARTLTIVVRGDEMRTERSIGIRSEKGEPPSPAVKIGIPLGKPSIFEKTVREGEVFFGMIQDSVLSDSLFREIGIPRSKTILLLPMRCRGQTVALTYGDFGNEETSPVPIDFLKILAVQAEASLEKALA